MRRRPTLIFVLVLLLLAAIAVWVLARQYRPLFSTDRSFDGQRAYQDVLQQVSFGPRVIGSDAHALAAAYIQDELRHRSDQPAQDRHRKHADHRAHCAGYEIDEALVRMQNGDYGYDEATGFWLVARSPARLRPSRRWDG